MNSEGRRQEQENPTFRRVIDYFLGHAKPKDDGAPKRKPAKRPIKKRVPKTKASK